MSERKFKVGDRVRLNDGDWTGVIGTVRGYAGSWLKVQPDAGSVYSGLNSGRPICSDYMRGPEFPGFYEENTELLNAPADNINPAHYGAGGDGIECIDAIKAQMTGEVFKGYLRGNIAKYVWRYEAKGGAESLEKAKWYLERLIAEVRADA